MSFRRNSSTYQCWADMKQRCNNPRNKKFKIYGALDITYQDSWENFANFLRDMGEKPFGHVLDRINPNADYSAENCRWISKTESARNGGRSQLCEREVRLIRAMQRSFRPHMQMREAAIIIAPLFKVNSRIIELVLRGVTWRGVV